MVLLMIICILIICIFIIIFRVKYYKDLYYTNYVCRNKIINETVKYVETHIDIIINEGLIANPNLLLRMVTEDVLRQSDKRVKTFYYNNRVIMDKQIQKTLIKQLNITNH